MKNNSPQKQAAISWIILMIGILLAVIGAMTAKEYRVNLCLLIGAMVCYWWYCISPHHDEMSLLRLLACWL